ncbi:MAG TPA: lipase maturation factor family protein [Thermoanaerobaculia bacterium]|nr:lipase maturation factor family protein [Thermoanaerobaculia bacterium]
MEGYLGDLWVARLLFLRGLASIYLVGFLSALNQFPALLGERGLLPAPEFLKHVRFRDAPSLFHWRYSDRLLETVAWLGIILSAIAILGIPEDAPWWISMAVWLVMWMLYLSIVNVGQRFYSFGWESMLLEAGFFAAFLGPRSLAPPAIVIVILRWMLFRVEFGAGLIKLRHDKCWRDLTCLFYHYETQPLPNPLSWYFHRLPKVMHKFSVLFSHFVQVIVPFGVFAPQPFASISGGLIIFHQLWLIISGNYSWLNWLTVVLGVTALSGGGQAPRLSDDTVYNAILYLLAAVTLVMSIKPALNFFSRNQLMNFCWNRIHLVCAYGAFGSITKQRYEIELEGSNDGTEWKAYGFRAKPGDVTRTPPQVAPYHLRIDWLMWFLPFSVIVTANRVITRGYEAWFIRFVQKLLEGDRQTLKLLRSNPFPDQPPKFIRAGFYLYQYTSWKERKETGAWWKRTWVDHYLPPSTLADATP